MASCCCRVRSAAARSSGFTLLEVLVALAVVAIALGALVSAAGMQTRNEAYLQDKTFAHWVAMNRAAEMQLDGDAVKIGETAGSEQMAQRTWFWKSVLATTEDPNVARATIEVRAAPKDDRPLFTLVAFVYRSGQKP